VPLTGAQVAVLNGSALFVREGMKGGHFSEVLQHCNTRSLAMEIRDCPLREIVRLRHTTVKHHLDDLRTLFIFASKNRGFANTTDGGTRLSRENGRNEWRPYRVDERIKIHWITAVKSSTTPSRCRARTSNVRPMHSAGSICRNAAARYARRGSAVRRAAQYGSTRFRRHH
jgi:hypothetical protein